MKKKESILFAMSLIYVSNLLEHLVALWDVRGAPGSRSLGPIVNRWFLLCGLRDNPLPHHVNLFEIVHLVKFSGRRVSFARKRPGFLAGSCVEDRIVSVEAARIRSASSSSGCDISRPIIWWGSSPLFLGGVW